MATPEEAAFWRAESVAAADPLIGSLKTAMRREFGLVADDFEAGRFSPITHAARTEDILARFYDAAGLRFLKMGRAMVKRERSSGILRVEMRDTATEFSARIAELVRVTAPYRARRLSARTNKIITQALTEAAEQGLGERETARLIRLRVQSGRVPLHRARTIARTEIGAAQNAGIISAADELHVQCHLTWITIRDGRERATHAAVNEVKIAPGQKFHVGSAELAHPGDPSGPPEEIINCRCTTLLEPI